eukprot:GFUD01099995.1.p1 GENE.GFUD01099995.1~~GFUD01099995.1.p1  ORF type:complete len:100 (+),score=13.10 GFUD01099995.1:3-302(+)
MKSNTLESQVTFWNYNGFTEHFNFQPFIKTLATSSGLHILKNKENIKMSTNLQATNSQVFHWLEDEQNQYILLLLDFGWHDWNVFNFDPFAGVEILFHL